jgi:hypothetical protein
VLLQLNPSIPVKTSKGPGEAIGWLDYSKEDDLLWVVFLDDSGECWIIPNKEIRAFENYSIGRNFKK